ncbi:MAG: HEPN domain-containing protein [Clostridia bacterium]
MNDYNKINYWIEMSEYDLETAKAMLKSKRYLYVGFMCNQVIEKILKAIYVKNIKQIPPYIHKLTKLAELSNLYNDMNEEQKKFLDNLQPMNI